ncbi:MAG: rRNA maturation RNase YbeY [Candidatus Omnitrophica bacterium]|nr:rRNA maturation RNase YbeY [Candidatus Omnitrophota bacterium]MDE2222455.1 rRNA maturation RNase YbeY [Candidatus Omnitrophota bacterium]
MRKLRLKLQGLSIVFVGPQRMRAINKKYLNHDFVTDVLTFDLGGGVAEIIVCPQAAQANARAYKNSTREEIILYVIHGLLHLAGYNDHSPSDAFKMRRMEAKLTA